MVVLCPPRTKSWQHHSTVPQTDKTYVIKVDVVSPPTPMSLVNSDQLLNSLCTWRRADESLFLGFLRKSNA